MKSIMGKLSALVLVAVTGLALVSCGGESNNLQDPTAGAVANCSDLGSAATCVTGRFVDDVAYNVNYECGLATGAKVKAVTTTDGAFTCPEGGSVTFSVINPDHSTDTDKKIILGSAVVVRPADIYGAGSGGTTVYAYLTPRNLTNDTTSATDFSVATLNIVRLMQTLGRDPTTEGTPAHRVVLADDDKRLLTSLAATVLSTDFYLPAASDPSNPGVDTFDYKVKDYLQSLPDAQKHVLITADKAKQALQRGIYSIASGMYTVPGSIISTASSSTATSAGISGAQNGSTLLGTMSVLVDRQGRMLGNGVYSLEPSSTPNQTLWTNPKAMDLIASGIADTNGYPLWPNNSLLTSVSLQLRDATDNITSKVFNIVQGTMDRQAIAGTGDIYTNLFGGAVDSTQLGRWTLMDSSTVVIDKDFTVISLEHAPAAAPNLDPDVWVGNTDNIAAKLPLAVTLTFCDSDTVTAPAAACNNTGAVLATVPVVLLQDGNIASDNNGRCGVGLDPATLKYSDNAAEFPLGTVSNVFNTAQSDGTYTMMSLLLTIPNNSTYKTLSPYLPYSQLNGNFGLASLLRVDGTAATNSKFAKLYNSTSVSSGGSTTIVYTVDQAQWGNYLTVLKYFQANSTAPSDSNTTVLLNSSHGHVYSAKTVCP